MSTSRTIRRTAALSVVSALALGATADASNAATFDLTTGTKVTSGQAVGRGSVAFPNAKTLKVRSKLDDRCSATGKGDGYAAFVEFLVTFADGSTAAAAASDERGCKPAAKSVFIDKTFAKSIRSVRVTVFEGRQTGAGQGTVAEAKRKTIRR